MIEVRDRTYVYKRMKQELAENTKELDILENTARVHFLILIYLFNKSSLNDDEKDSNNNDSPN